jgi:E3 ubiquitin-protein ligase HUWE1
MFILADTNEVIYRINPNAEKDEHILDCFGLLGKIMGKAVFEKIPLNCYFDRSIIKYLLGQPLDLEDIFYFDKSVSLSF